MDEIKIRDGDLVVCAGYTTGRALEAVQESGADVTVLVAGPTFDREYAGVSIAEFAQTATNATVRLLLPQHESRSLLDEGIAEYVPSRSPDQTAIIRRAMTQADRVVGVCETSNPEDGTFTPGACGLFVPTVLSAADLTVAEVNPMAPRLPGLSFRVNRFDHQLHAECELPQAERPDIDSAAKKVGENVADLIADGATIELGVGRIPIAIARSLSDHTDLGMHSGLVRPVVRKLIEDGIVTRGSQVAEKQPDCPLSNPILANTVLGDEQSFYSWAAESGAVTLDNIHKTTDPSLVASNPHFTAVNSAIQVDIQGQVNAERFGGRQLSTAGGQPAYFRAARKSDCGIGIIALTSETSDGVSKIVPALSDDAVVTTPRVDIDCVVTEHGIADLFGESLSHRTEELIGVAPPTDRDGLRHTAEDFGLI